MTARLLEPLVCPRCGVCDVPTVGPGAGPHAYRACCRHCGRFLTWLRRAIVEGTNRMSCLNRVTLLGQIAKAGVTIKYATTGTPCASFTLVLSERGQDQKEHYLFIDCEVWGRKAESAGELESGQLCRFEGKLAKRKRGEQWELVVAGFELTPVLAPLASMTGSSN
jgi:primosomal replication protein N